jgi:hypothetical protein
MREGSASFLKKRSKKRLAGVVGVHAANAHEAI